ncbi:hypothetical protein DFJ58DRAFT_725679 [Suillus subalutaceus]|uniref:uncharacterized protein n=1 Tax=Suillus subalutaceus TaxID=48586 RepID=UPI001B866D78|nr:uncharacterized protein DFJ58DRAFT_869412 [Suillus subalutaceus]XP_041246020.1 uncharacterized protein DFJ58DRAFT_725679 [Suillus subalutaceus]KAG1834007.1 hypothetical protein DFJ58DRAFT_869412 [Suillus subalutaceus]KAG1861500.1 hypothetical protein DFJ58DRAFT_725679 [Suillus subalutaceus]
MSTIHDRQSSFNGATSAQHVENHDPGSLRVLGSVGGPKPGTGITNMLARSSALSLTCSGKLRLDRSSSPHSDSGAIETRPGAATVPFFGIEPAILDPVSGKELEGSNVEGALVIKQPWP